MLNTYRFTIKTVHYTRFSDPCPDNPNKQVKIVVTQALKNDRKAIEEAKMYNDTPFFGQRMFLEKVEVLEAVSVDNETGSRVEEWREIERY
jgi:hypothetical protein